MTSDLLLLAAGLVLLFAGGEGLVRGAVSFANRLGMPPLLVGMTVIGFGTSLPEFLVCLQAALRGSPDIAVGNIVGSNIANILLVVGVAAVLSPIVARGTSLLRDTGVMVAACVALLLLGWSGGIGRVAGLVLFVSLVVYLAAAMLIDRAKEVEPDEEAATRLSGWVEGLLLLGGFAALFVGAELLVGSAVRLARDAGLSEATIGLTVVAVGTSLPEIAAAISAAMRRQGAVVLGNVIGSNLFNILATLGLTAAIHPVDVSADIARFDVPVMTGLAVLLGLALALGGRFGRVLGLVMLAGYAAYVAMLL
ncbi:calcium/sodium antiporter [Pararhizobium mangrovi]|uniref:calcium/sodium antiporter n=1 Tax=Pararhizobium mangrovi TaxID=2590452 RepID=UPI001AEDBDA6|nr:calcium/sodium antiporter [Pararhizobium mangrovi]